MPYNCMEIYKSYFSAWYGKEKRDIRDVVLNGGFQWKVMANICEIPISTWEVNGIYTDNTSTYKWVGS